MATIAEMRARLARHLPPELKAGEQDEQRKQETTGVAKEVAPESEAVQRMVAISGEVALGNQVVVTVQTELQPTTLVVVERPVEQTSVDRPDSLVGVSQSQETNLDTSNPIHQGFLQRLSDLEAALLQRDPLMKTHLGVIHKTMIEYEEIANLLTPDEIRKIMTAQQAHTGIILKQELIKESKSRATAKASKIGIGDI